MMLTVNICTCLDSGERDQSPIRTVIVFFLGTTVKINLHGILVIKLLDSGELSSVILRTQERAVLLMWSVTWLSAVNKMSYAWNNKNQFIFNKILLFDY